MIRRLLAPLLISLLVVPPALAARVPAERRLLGFVDEFTNPKRNQPAPLPSSPQLLDLINGYSKYQGRRVPVRDRCGRVNARGPGSECSSSSSPTMQLILEYLYPFPGGVQLPVQIDGNLDTPAVVIKINNGSGCFEALKQDGSSAGTWANDGCTGNVVTNIPGQLGRDFGKLGDLTGFPITLTSAYMDSLFQPNSDNTFIFFTLNRPDPSNFYWYTRRSGGTSGHFQVYSDGGGVVACGYYPLDPRSGINSVAFYAWTAIVCRKSSTTYTVSYQTDDDPTVDATPLTAIAGTGGWSIGSRHDGAFQLRGIWVAGLVYAKALSNAQVHDVIDAWEGDSNPGKFLTWRNSQPVGIDHLATTGQIDMMDGASPLVSPTGLIGSSGFTNYAATDGGLALGGSVGDALGTPTVAAAAASGPFSVNQNRAEVGRVLDDDGAAFEGWCGRNMAGAHPVNPAAPAVYDYNVSVIQAKGDAGTTVDQVRLFVATTSADGGPVTATVADGGTACLATLTDAYTRPDCVVRVTGPAATIQGCWAVGWTAGVTGSTMAAHFQTTDGPALEPPVLTPGVVSPIYDIMDVATDGIPDAAAGGCVEVVHTSGYDSWRWLNIQKYDYRMLDPYLNPGPTHACAQIRNYTTGETSYHCGLLTPGVVSERDVTYVDRVCWRPRGAGKCDFFAYADACGATPYDTCFATTQINQDITGTLDCPGTAQLANVFARETGSVAGSFKVRAARWYKLQ